MLFHLINHYVWAQDYYMKYFTVFYSFRNCFIKNNKMYFDRFINSYSLRKMEDQVDTNNNQECNMNYNSKL